MVKIKIISGNFGYYNDKGMIERKTADSEAFFVPEKTAKKLVKLNIAVVVPNNDNNYDSEEKVNVITANYSSAMSFKELQKYAEENNITGHENAKNKASLLLYLDNYYEKENTASGEKNDNINDNINDNTDDEAPPLMNVSGAE